MSLGVRRVSFSEDREEMLCLLGRNLHYPHKKGFDWRYIRNPAGTAWSWFLHEGSDRNPIAMASLFPRRVYVDGKEMRAGQVMHFVVEPKYRSLGPAVLLQRATFAPVDSGELDFCYDCPPHDEGMSTFIRLGIRANTELVRYALVLRSDEYLTKKLGSKTISRPAAALVNLILRVRYPRSGVESLEISRHEGEFDDEFSVLDRLVPTEHLIRHRRSAEELNYRFRDNPEFLHTTVVARTKGELLAFAVFLETDGVGMIVDIFGRELETAGPPLLDAVVDLCRKSGMRAVYATCSERSAMSSLLVEKGFHPRERAARVVAYTKSNTVPSQLLANGIRWCFSQVEWLG